MSSEAAPSASTEAKPSTEVSNPTAGAGTGAGGDDDARDASTKDPSKTPEKTDAAASDSGSDFIHPPTDAETGKIIPTDAASPEKKDEEKKDEEFIFGQPPSNRVSVALDRGRRVYLNRARKILRLGDVCTVGGLGQAISVAVDLVEILKREKVAVVKKIETSMVEGDSNSQLRSKGRKPKIEITLGRGEWAHLVADYRRRKVIDIFEKKDPEGTGKLSCDLIRGEKLWEKLKTEAEPQKEAEAYLAEKKDALNLPEFIHYCSILIHPLMVDRYFNKALDEYNERQDADETETAGGAGDTKPVEVSSSS